MLTAVLLCSLVGLTTAAYGWKPGQQYKYNIESRTVAGLDQVANKFSGTLIRGKLHINVDSDNLLTLQVREAVYADFNQQLNEGWETNIPEEQIRYKTFPLKTLPFRLGFNNGTVEKMIVGKELSYWERNFLKGIASQFQIGVQAENLNQSKLNDVPRDGLNAKIFKTMEESISGKYETYYDISVVPEYLMKDRTELEPLQNLRGDGDYYRIVKTRNFSNSAQHIVHSYGSNGEEEWTAGTNSMGDFLTRTSVSTIVVSGRPNAYTIQSTVTTEKVLIAPHLYYKQKGIVASRMNLTLEEVTESEVSSPSIDNPIILESLVYEYERGNQKSGESEKDSTFSTSESRPPDSGVITEVQRQKRSAKWDKGNKINNNLFSREGSSIASSENMVNKSQNEVRIVENIVRLSKKIGWSLYKPSDIPKDSVLTLYSILTRIVGSSSSQELLQATEMLHFTRNGTKGFGKQGYKDYISWQVFRDAVAEAGSVSALVTMSFWIKSGKVNGNEAAQLLSALPKAARYPTTEYMNYFFDLIKSNEIRNQKYLNDSATLSFTDLIKRSQVDMAGAQSQNRSSVVTETYIPYFKNQLENAIAQGDSIKAQVYIRALGNTAHPTIFAVFEPYLEGKRLISEFQRFLMVASLDEVTKLHNKLAKPILYRIYQNQGEAAEIRVAAVMQLMKANPSAQLLQRMAEQTNYDHSKQVNAAVKSAIESLAKGEYNAKSHIIENARSAADFLTSENYGSKYSKNFISSYMTKEEADLRYHQHLSFIQGLDGVYPDAVIYNLVHNFDGFIREPYKFSYMSSGSKQLMNLLLERFGRDYPKQETSRNKRTSPRETENSKYTYQILSETLNWEKEEPLQVEGNLMTSVLGGKRFFAFDNHTIEQLPKLMWEMNEKLQNGVNIQEAKFFDEFSIEVRFPLITGVQFTYSLNVPTLVYIGMEGNGYLEMRQIKRSSPSDLPVKARLDGEYRFVLSTQRRGEAGFVAPYSNQRHVAAVEKNSQFYFPLKGKIEVDGNTFRTALQPFEDSNDLHKIFQYSSHAYTTYQNVNDVKPYIKGKNAQFVHTGQKKICHRTFGKQQTGYELHIDADNDRINNMALIFNDLPKHNYDLLTYMLKYDMEKLIGGNYLAISYNPMNSSAHAISFELSYDGKTLRSNEYRQENSEETDNAARPSLGSSTMEKLKKFSGRMEAPSNTRMLVASVSIGDTPGVGIYQMSLAHSASPVSDRSSYVFEYVAVPLRKSKNSENTHVTAVFDIKKPLVPILNYKDALNADATTHIEGEINFEGSVNSKLEFMGTMQKTEERKQYLRNHPLTSVCDQQMEEGNYVQPACLEVADKAKYLDKYDLSVKYQNVPYEDALQKLYGLVRRYGYNRFEGDMEEVNNHVGEIKLGVRLSKNLRTANISIQSPNAQISFKDVQIGKWARPWLVQHPRYKDLDLFWSNIMYNSGYTRCSLDAHRVSTFNNRSYPINLGDCNHVLAMSVPNHYQKGDQESPKENEYGQKNFAVLVKDTGSNQKKVQIILGEDVITLDPSEATTVFVQANGEYIQLFQDRITNWRNGLNEIEAYALPNNNNALINLRSHGIQLVYDGQRVILFMKSHYRNDVRGLCGTFDGESANDFTTPSKCVLRNHRDFAASYVVADDTCRGPARELFLKAKNVPCYPIETTFADIISDDEAGRGKTNSMTGMKTKGCSTFRLSILQDSGRTCFSLKPQLICRSHCKAPRTIKKIIDFVCLQDSVATKHWLTMNEKGIYPNFGQNKPNHQASVMLPEKCILQ